MAETRPQSTSRLEKSAKRRQMIVETAAGLFIEKGFHQTGMRDIAGKAGISLSNLYNHFKGKNEIIAAISELETVELATSQRTNVRSLIGCAAQDCKTATNLK